MLKIYFKERRSWIFLFLLLQLLLVFIAYIDPALSLISVLYYIFLSTIIFISFFFLRCHKESKYFYELTQSDNGIQLSGFPEPISPFENIVAGSIINLTKELSESLSKNEFMLEQEKDDLLTWIHEVKTPLTALRLMIDRIEDQTTKKQMTYEWLRIHLLLDQQLHNRRIPSMENDLYMEKVDLEGLIFTEIKTLQVWCIQKGLGIDVELAVQEVITDAKWLAFILRQLLTNAVKYSSNSDITIRSFNYSGQTVLEIKDRGRGIDQRDMHRIFERGFTSTIHHQDQSSTGMGLYLVSKVAVPLNIHIQVSSKAGEGTKFTLTFSKNNEVVDITGM